MNEQFNPIDDYKNIDDVKDRIHNPGNFPIGPDVVDYLRKNPEAKYILYPIFDITEFMNKPDNLIDKDKSNE